MPTDFYKHLKNGRGQTAGSTTAETTSDKVKRVYGLNPFLKRNGELINPYLNYQQLLDSDKVNSKVKDYISEATGLTSTIQPAVETTSTDTTTQTSSLPDSDNSIAKAAKNYLGTPYVWGGESLSEGGMDCSGFVYNALRDAGYQMGRTTAQGYRGYGQIVPKDSMQEGDLIFFGKNGTATHIGIYLGNGQMIHSSGGQKNTKSNPGKGVNITSVDHRSDFIEARRY